MKNIKVLEKLKTVLFVVFSGILISVAVFWGFDYYTHLLHGRAENSAAIQRCIETGGAWDKENNSCRRAHGQ